jgi:hypothetical protein
MSVTSRKQLSPQRQRALRVHGHVAIGTQNRRTRNEIRDPVGAGNPDSSDCWSRRWVVHCSSGNRADGYIAASGLRRSNQITRQGSLKRGYDIGRPEPKSVAGRDDARGLDHHGAPRSTRLVQDAFGHGVSRFGRNVRCRDLRVRGGLRHRHAPAAALPTQVARRRLSPPPAELKRRTG